jgi:K(+)-stimulated pyrophosphate-energized sodium pump
VEPLIWLYLAIVLGFAALALAVVFGRQVISAPAGNDRMVQLMGAIREGAMAFLRREYTAVAVFVVILAALIFTLLDWGRPWGAIAYVSGAVLSASAGFIGMRIATAANARTAEAARLGGIDQALPLAFRGGAVMGFTVAGLGLLGLSLGYLVFVEILEVGDPYDVLTAIGLGGSSIALFARVGGGIYTKAADVGADLVGKVEAGIPEDDPRNPATIADNVGDNVGDVAGMGADLFESYLGSMIAPIVYAAFTFGGFAGGTETGFFTQAVMYPLLIATVGMGASIIGSFLVRPGGGSLAAALHRGTWTAAILTTAAVAILTPVLFGGIDDVDNAWGLVLSVVIGLAIGLLIGQISEWFTSDHHTIVKEVARQAQTGPATVVLSGIAEGMRSAAFSVMVVAAGMGGAYWAGSLAFEDGGIYGIAVAAIGMLSTLGITVSVDAYGPIADNAGGIAEMAHLPPEVRTATDALDSLGNTTAAVAKGFAIGSAAVTALALFFTFKEAVVKAGGTLDTIDILNVETTVGLVHRRHVPVPVRRHDHQGGRPCRQPDDRGGATSVPRDPRLARGAGGRGARVRQVRRHLDGSCAAGDAAPRVAGGGAAPRHRVHQRRGPRRPARRRPRHRLPARHLHGQLRRCLGQRQEVHRGRRLRRQGIGRPQGGRRRRHHRRPVQGHRRTRHEHRHQGDDDREPHLRLGVRVGASPAAVGPRLFGADTVGNGAATSGERTPIAVAGAPVESGASPRPRDGL